MEIKRHFCSLSEAIREGAKLSEQSFSDLFEMRLTGYRSCALGAAYEAIYNEIVEDGEYHAECYVSLERLYSYMEKAPSAGCPIFNCDTPVLKQIEDVIVHLNDDHRWARERIADWLESEEEKLGYVLLTEAEEPKAVSREHEREVIKCDTHMSAR